MKYYFTALYKSLTSPSWLASQSKATTRAGKFFVMVMLVLSLGVGAHIIYRQIPSIVPIVEQGITEHVPDFTAKLTDGELVVSDLTQPYINYFTDEQNKEFVIVIDTVSTGTLALPSFFVSSTEGGVLITRDRIVSQNLDGQADINEAFDQVPNLTFSRAQIIQTLEDIGGRYRPAIFAVFVALSFAFWGLGLLVFILLFSTIAFAIYSAISKQDKKVRYSWKEIFTMSLFAFGLPKLIVTLVMFGFYTPLHYVVTGTMTLVLIRTLSIPKQGSEQQNGSEPPFTA